VRDVCLETAKTEENVRKYIKVRYIAVNKVPRGGVGIRAISSTPCSYLGRFWFLWGGTDA